MSHLESRRDKTPALGLEISPAVVEELAKRLGVSAKRLSSMSKPMRILMFRARTILLDYPARPVSASTERDYRRKVAHLERLSDGEPGLLDIRSLPAQKWSTKRAWYAYRAALIFAARQAVADGYAVLTSDAPEKEPDARRRVLRMKNAVRIIETYRPDVTGTQAMFSGAPGDWHGNLTERRSAPRNARRKNLRKLNHLGDWIDTVVQHCMFNVDKKTDKTALVSNRNVDKVMMADLVSVLAATGVRPAELLKGVELSLVNGRISARIQGAKVKEADGARVATGHVWRQIELRPDTPESQYLMSRLRELGGAYTVGADFAPRAADRPRELRRLIARVGHEALGPKVSLSPYDFRHAVSARAKAADDLSTEEIAMLLGQRSTRTQKNYGTAQQSGGRRSSVMGVTAASEVRTISDRKRTSTTGGLKR